MRLPPPGARALQRTCFDCERAQVVVGGFTQKNRRLGDQHAYGRVTRTLTDEQPLGTNGLPNAHQSIALIRSPLEPLLFVLTGRAMYGKSVKRAFLEINMDGKASRAFLSNFLPSLAASPASVSPSLPLSRTSLSPHPSIFPSIFPSIHPSSPCPLPPSLPRFPALLRSLARSPPSSQLSPTHYLFACDADEYKTVESDGGGATNATVVHCWRLDSDVCDWMATYDANNTFGVIT